MFLSNPNHFRRERYWTYVHDNLRDKSGPQSYKAHYGMNKVTFDYLVSALSDHPDFQLQAINATSTYIQIAAVLWRYANCHFGYRIFEATMGFSQGSYHNFSERFLAAMIDTFGNKVRLPCTREEFDQVKQIFNILLVN
jgi:hypothetical protein